MPPTFSADRSLLRENAPKIEGTIALLPDNFKLAVLRGDQEAGCAK
jgi:hypothetical protein